jgi:hypothetical protein
MHIGHIELARPRASDAAGQLLQRRHLLVLNLGRLPRKVLLRLRCKPRAPSDTAWP